MNFKKRLLQIISVLFVFGGIVRLFANKALFAIFQMEELWTDHLYFIYIYRVLGAFVILSGLILFTISKNQKLYSNLSPVLAAGFVLIGLVMIITGILLELPPMFYVADFMFCFIVAWFFYDMRTPLDQKQKKQNQ